MLRYLISMLICITLATCGSEDEAIIPPIVTPPIIIPPTVTPPADGPSISLLSQTIIRRNLVTDVWGYIDQSTGKEYAIVGDFTFRGNNRVGGYTLVDVSEPSNPQIASSLTNVIGADMKTSGHYLYMANSGNPNAADDSSRVVDISDPMNPVVVGAFQAAHNIFVAGSYLYVSFEDSSGLRIFDIGTDPAIPQLVWEANIFGRRDGHDVAVIRDRMYDFHGPDGTYIYDVSDPANPQLLGAVRHLIYHHSGWVTDDDNFLFICDESAKNQEADVTIWDITDPANAVLVGDITDPFTRVHNLYIIDTLAYVSYYEAGLKIFDVSTPAEPKLLDQFNTNLNKGTGLGSGFTGAWGVYPFSPTGNIFVSDVDNGLFVFEYR